MRSLVLSLSFVILWLCSCATKETNYTPTEIACIGLPVMFGSYLMYNSNYSNDSLLYFNDVENQDNILVCKLTKDGAIILDTANLPNSSHIFETFVLGYDSIASFEHLPNRLMTLFHNNGSVISTHSFENGGPYINMVSKQPRIGNVVAFANTNDSVATSGVLRSEYFRTVHPIYQYDLASGKGKSWGYFPDVYAMALGYEETPLISMVNDSTFLVSFARVDSLYLYVNGVLRSRYHCKSSYIDHFPECDPNMMYDLGYYREFTNLRSEYSDVMYDPYDQRFFRIAIHEKPVDEQGKKVKETNRTWSVMVINKNFEVEKEYLFQYQEYVPLYVILDHRGLFVSKTPANEDDLQLKLSLFKL